MAEPSLGEHDVHASWRTAPVAVAATPTRHRLAKARQAVCRERSWRVERPVPAGSCHTGGRLSPGLSIGVGVKSESGGFVAPEPGAPRPQRLQG